jgi:predicted Zn finger-like uncharacterized protein
MALNITCPACQTVYPVNESMVGQTLKCKACGAGIPVRAGAGAAARPTAAKPMVAKALPADDREDTRPARPARRPRDDDDYDDDRPRVKKGEKKKSALPLLVAGGLAALLVAGGAGAYFAGLFGGQTKPEVADGGAGAGKGGPPSPMSPPPAPNKEPDEYPPVMPGRDPKTGKLLSEMNKATKPTAAPSEPERKQAIPAPLAQIPKGTTTAPAGSPPPPTKTEPDPATLKRCKDATVLFRVEDKNGKKWEGSGWFGLESNLIVTNAHVLGMKTPNSLPPKKITIFTQPGTPQEKEIPHAKLKIMAVDRDRDLGLLQVINVPAADLPAPLKVRPSAELRDLEPMFIYGFPAGTRIAVQTRSSKPPVVTVNRTSVGAIRRDDDGNMFAVQFQGGAYQGNSGGPIVDADGNVVAVVFAGASLDALGAAVAYGVPTEYVNGLVAGRVAEVEYGQPYAKDGKVHIPVTAQCLDPFNRLTEVGVGYWVGENTKKTRPPGPTRTPQEPGETDYQEVKLAYKHTADKQVATGEVVVPMPAAGRAYWVQPYYSNALQPKQFLAGNPVKMSGPPVDLIPADLIVRYRPGAKRSVSVSNKNDLQQFEEGEGANKEERVLFETEVEMTETVSRPATGEAVAALLLDYKKLALKAQVGTRTVEDIIPSELRRLLNEGIKQVQGLVQVNRRGEIFNLQSNLRGTGGFAPIFKGFSDESLEALAAASLPLPNERVNPGHTWTATKNARLAVLFLDPADALPPAAGKQPGVGGAKQPRKGRTREYRFQEETTYTYVGSRTRAGVREAVVKVEGFIKPAPGTPADRGASGRVKGYAYVDLDTGVILEAALEKELEVDSSGDGVKRRLSGINEYKLTRGSVQ